MGQSAPKTKLGTNYKTTKHKVLPRTKALINIHVCVLARERSFKTQTDNFQYNVPKYDHKNISEYFFIFFF